MLMMFKIHTLLQRKSLILMKLILSQAPHIKMGINKSMILFSKVVKFLNKCTKMLKLT